MRLATVKTGSRDGSLVVVKRDLSGWTHAEDLAGTLQAALDRWDTVAPRLAARAQALEEGRVPMTPYDATQLHSPLPRAYEWIDASSFLNHVLLVRKARKAEPPPTLRTDPLVYQGGSGDLLGPTDDIPLADPAWGCDFESEVVCILGDVKQGTTPAQAAGAVRLLCLANDVSLRNLVPDELAKGFGFFQSKPATAFSPVACTPDELGDAWQGGRLHLRLKTWLNGALVGDCEAGPEMHFSFFDLIAHLARTRSFTAGTLLGSGTVSNADPARGVSCLAERRMIETLQTGAPRTPFLAWGDRVAIEMFDAAGKSLFGRIAQQVTKAQEPSP